MSAGHPRARPNVAVSTAWDLELPQPVWHSRHCRRRRARAVLWRPQRERIRTGYSAGSGRWTPCAGRSAQLREPAPMPRNVPVPSFRDNDVPISLRQAAARAIPWVSRLGPSPGCPTAMKIAHRPLPLFSCKVVRRRHIRSSGKVGHSAGFPETAGHGRLRCADAWRGGPSFIAAPT